ncbi:MAG: hypothetical protein IPP22_05975 [Nitrosomonas sp.]|nr:hypothetical protein [Nitrosomonas sp.]
MTAHMLHRDFQNRQAFFDGGQVQLDRWVGGLMVQFVNDHTLFNRPKLISGWRRLRQYKTMTARFQQQIRHARVH